MLGVLAVGPLQGWSEAGTGKATIHVSDDSDQGRSVLVQPDGKIIFAGTTLNGVTTEMSFRFTPKGLFGGGNWRIDDVFVDPWKSI